MESALTAKMKNKDLRKSVAVYVSILIGVCGFVFLYLLPRWHENGELAERIASLERTRSEVIRLLREERRLRRELPSPKPDVPGWVAEAALGGMERKLVSNDPYRKGAGAQVKLRNLNPKQVFDFMVRLLRVDLIIRRIVISDWDRNGNWDLEIFLEIPEGAKLP